MSSSETSVSLTWLGFDAIRYLIIFGDSYSAVHDSRFTILPRPTEQEPLGCPWPGRHWCEPGTLNWVGHLVKSTQEKKKDPPLLVIDYAVGGSTVTDGIDQVDDGFITQIAKTPLTRTMQWTEENTLFTFWFGINDCPKNLDDDLALIVGYLITQAEEVYDAGGRNFLFIDVPPIDRSPAFQANPTPVLAGRYAKWNIALREQFTHFQANYPLARAFLFSAHDTFTRLLDDPVAYGLNADDVSKPRSSIWTDYLHPTSAVHAILAKDIEAFLREQQPESLGAILEG